MTTDTIATAVQATTVVDASAERAFEVFTSEIGTWWPPDHHILKAELAEMVFEPRAGGHVIDRGVDGSECRWARVLVYEPPTRVVISWDINLAWQLEEDQARTSEIEIRFVEEEVGRTRVLLEHRHLDRHGDGWEQMREAVGSPDGWNAGLQRFAARAAAQSGRCMSGFLFKLIPPRPDFAFTMSADEKATMLEHVHYWGELATAGKTLAYGPVNDPTGGYGIGIVLADSLQQAERLRDGDPAMRSSHGFRTEILPMLRLVTPTASYDAAG